jgi:hypothetical protein
MSEEHREVIRETVHEVLFQLGLSAENHDEIAELRKDFSWTRSARKTSEKVGMHGVLAAVTVAIGGVLAAFWVGLQQYMGGNHNG